ncbi:DUF1015 family protein [Jutongia sp.]|uniref:DUF1015 domain-containing protein n=1 Tax=Jutongia sp. TaxID=2944204 RepID=UPI003079FC8E
MAQIKPFMAVRPVEELADRVAALPYDVYNRQEAKKEVQREPLSFLKIDRAETQFPDEVDTYDPCVYQKAAELLKEMEKDGVYVSDHDKAYYIYRLTMNGRAQTGIVACASVDDYLENVIKKHENTREEKEQDRIRHVDTLSAQTGPIFLAYRSKEEINQVVASVMEQEAPLYDFTAVDGISHTVWKISAQDQVKRIQDTFASIDDIYIADGHHRAASAVKVGLKRRQEHPGYDGTEEFNYFLSVLFPDDQLTMYLEGQWYLLEASEAMLTESDAVKSLDVSLLQEYLLEPVLGIHDPRTDDRIDFVGGIRGLEELEKRTQTDMKVAFAMYPTSIAELFAVADAGLLMPPKSTWFEPKLRSGLFIHEI